MKIDYRRLTENELDTFINMRINQLREETFYLLFNLLCVTNAVE